MQGKPESPMEEVLRALPGLIGLTLWAVFYTFPIKLFYFAASKMRPRP
jgi:hypothetical protein